MHDLLKIVYNILCFNILFQQSPPVIKDFVHRLFKHCPDETGYAMCDFFEDDNGKITTFDPGLRPTGNSASSMVNLWLKKEGKNCFIKNLVPFEFNKSNKPYSEIVDTLGDLANPEIIKKTGYGVLPWGYNHIQEKGHFILITPSEDKYNEFYSNVNERLGGALG